MSWTTPKQWWQRIEDLLMGIWDNDEGVKNNPLLRDWGTGKKFATQLEAVQYAQIKRLNAQIGRLGNGQPGDRVGLEPVNETYKQMLKTIVDSSLRVCYQKGLALEFNIALLQDLETKGIELGMDSRAIRDLKEEIMEGCRQTWKKFQAEDKAREEGWKTLEEQDMYVTGLPIMTTQAKPGQFSGQFSVPPLPNVPSHLTRPVQINGTPIQPVVGRAVMSGPDGVFVKAEAGPVAEHLDPLDSSPGSLLAKAFDAITGSGPKKKKDAK